MKTFVAEMARPCFDAAFGCKYDAHIKAFRGAGKTDEAGDQPRQRMAAPCHAAFAAGDCRACKIVHAAYFIGQGMP